MKRLLAVAGIVAGLAFAAAGCSSGPETGGGGAKGFPKTESWEPAMAPRLYQANDTSLVPYVGESMKTQLLENGLDHWLVKVYVQKGWTNDKAHANARQLLVEMYFHKMEVGAEKTFQQWHTGISINDVGEKAFLDSDAAYFLRGAVVVRVKPVGPWQPRTAGPSAIEVARAIDAWMQGK